MTAPLFPKADTRPPGKLGFSKTYSLFQAFDWADTTLGPVATWPAALTMTIRMMLASPVAMAVLIGRDGVMIYNDAYIEIAGKRHPDCFGRSVFATWPEVAAFNRQIIADVFSGKTASFEDAPLTLYRNGAAEDVWLDLDYSPVVDDDGSTIAVLAILAETTKRVKAEKSLRDNQERLSLALSASGVVGIWDWHVQEDRVYADERFSDLFHVPRETARHGAPISAYLASIHADDVAGLEAAMKRAIETGESFTSEYRIVQPEGGVRWVLAEGRPARDETGACIRFPGVAVDITEHRQAVEAHARSEAAFRTLANAMPQMVWSTRPDGYHDYYNARWYEFTGVPENSTDGEGWNGMFHEEDQARAWASWRHSLETGDPYQIEYRLRHRSGVYRWVLGRALAIRDDRGRITRWYGTCTDIHDAKMAAAEREVVAHELSHRIKNIFSVLSSIISLSARSNPDAQPFALELRKRIEAMGRAHDFVRPHSQASRPVPVEQSIFGLIQELLVPYGNAEDRISVSGEDIQLGDSAATPLALLLHELATNAAKYGALSGDTGRLAISGRQQEADYILEWREHDGTGVVDQPDQEGFGSRLMKISVEGQLGGKLVRRWEKDGVHVTVTMPRAAVTRTNRLSGQRD
ncbi:PAS domain-containing protein [Ensifer sp.]|uniref:PAS domain-containing sensor histidine kinase n=1 Tax=Ensifer sp. TaxID=1872086 RepID=UPI00289C538A|nr:PAS domain-containing protein [Ensifer sp.]